jgi:hypothetical protein
VAKANTLVDAMDRSMLIRSAKIHIEFISLSTPAASMGYLINSGKNHERGDLDAYRDRSVRARTMSLSHQKSLFLHKKIS